VVGGIFIKILTDDAAWKKWASRALPPDPPPVQYGASR
jgi:hypothetical protein